MCINLIGRRAAQSGSRAPRRAALKAAGFTLLEILIVIAIIALLAAILFPVFVRVREQARKTTCQSNLRQLGLGFAQYMQDYDEFYPIAFAQFIPLPPHNDEMSWDREIATYVGAAVVVNKAPTIFACPDDDIVRTVAGSNTTRSYAMNAAAIGSPPQAFGVVGNRCTTTTTPACPNTVWPGRHIAEIPDPTGTILLAEYIDPGNRFASYSGATVSCPADQESGVPGQPLHSGGWNYLFCDGHVKWLRPEATIDLNPTDGLTGVFQSTSFNNRVRGMWTRAAGD